MNEKNPIQAFPLIILILGALAISSCSQGGSIPTHSPVTLTSTIEPTPTLEVLTATGLTPQQNVQQYGIPGEIVPFEYAVPDGMIKDPTEIQAMIEAKIVNLRPVVTLRHTLSHTSGMGHDGISRELRFPPGAGYSYSANGFLCTQKVLEEVTSKSLEELGQEMVFQPSGNWASLLCRCLAASGHSCTRRY